MPLESMELVDNEFVVAMELADGVEVDVLQISIRHLRHGSIVGN